jgi:hypothetical protein
MNYECNCPSGCKHDDLEPTSGGCWQCPECGHNIDESVVSTALCPYPWHDSRCTKDVCRGYTEPPGDDASDLAF